MKIREITIGAVIKTGEFANIAPSITIELSANENLEVAEKSAMNFIKNLAGRFSIYGELKEAEIIKEVGGIKEIKKIGI